MTALRAVLAPFVILALAGAGCASAPAESPTASEASPTTETTLRLKVEESATVGDVAIRLAEVVEDSRCPRGVQCITEGRARVRVVIGDRSVVLTVPGGRMTDDDTSSATVGDVVVAITDLEPYPEADGDGPEPVAVLTVSPR